MKAPRLVEARRFDWVEVPSPTLGPDSVLVRVSAVSICGSDLLGYLGEHPRIRPPTVLGHEASGLVTEVGRDVTEVELGTRVAIDPTFGCGVCRLCLQGRKNICRDYVVLGESQRLPGAMAGWLSVPWSSVHALPDSVTDAEGAVVQPLAVSLHAARDQGQVQAGQTVLIFGAGQIGLGILLAAKAAGARTLVVDPIEYRREVARRLGADLATGTTERSLRESVMEATDGYGADVAFEAVGGRNVAVLMEAVRLTASGGRIVVVGLKVPTAAIPAGELKSGEKMVIGSQAHPDSFPEVIARLARREFATDELITHRFALEDMAEAFQLLETRADGVVKVVLEANG